MTGQGHAVAYVQVLAATNPLCSRIEQIHL